MSETTQKSVEQTGGKREIRRFFSGFGGGGRAHPRPQRGGFGGGGLRIIAAIVAVVVVFGNGQATEITAQLLSSAILWGAVGYAVVWVAQYAFDASWEGDWGLFIARVTMPMIALLVFSTVGLSIATGAASRIATVTATAPPVQNASNLASSLVRLVGNLSQEVTGAIASLGGSASWNQYATGVDAPMSGQVVGGLVDDLFGGSNVVVDFTYGNAQGGNYAPAAMPTVVSPAKPVPTVAATPISTLLKTVAGGHDRYVVKAGDTMSGIAAKVLGSGNRYVELCAANVQRVGPGCSLRPGMEIIVPTDVQAYRPPTSKPVTAVQPVVARIVSDLVPVAQGQKTYTIQSGDNMFSIASKNGGINTMYAICQANVGVLGGDCDQLTAGVTLVIP